MIHAGKSSGAGNAVARAHASAGHTRQQQENFRGAARVGRVFIRDGGGAARRSVERAATTVGGTYEAEILRVDIYRARASTIRVNCGTNAIYSRERRTALVKSPRV